MKLKTSVHVNLDLHFGSDDLNNGAELARLAMVYDGLYMLIRAQQQEGQGGGRGIAATGRPASPDREADHGCFQETPQLAQLAAEARQIEAEPPAPPAVEPEPAPTQRAPFTQPASRSMAFEEYDRLVRAEMKRLSTGGVMPAISAWDRARDPRLPTMAAVVRRYKCKNIPELAAKLGLAPARPAPAAKRP